MPLDPQSSSPSFPLWYPLETARYRVGEVLSVLAVGFSVGSASVRGFGHSEATVTTWPSRFAMPTEKLQLDCHCLCLNVIVVLSSFSQLLELVIRRTVLVKDRYVSARRIRFPATTGELGPPGPRLTLHQPYALGHGILTNSISYCIIH